MDRERYNTPMSLPQLPSPRSLLCSSSLHSSLVCFLRTHLFTRHFASCWRRRPLLFPCVDPLPSTSSLIAFCFPPQLRGCEEASPGRAAASRTRRGAGAHQRGSNSLEFSSFILVPSTHINRIRPSFHCLIHAFEFPWPILDDVDALRICARMHMAVL